MNPELSVATEAEWSANYHRKSYLEPEKALMMAILEDAYDIACKPDHSLCLESRQWIEDEENGWIFSFVSVCSELDLDPDYVRRGMRMNADYRTAPRVKQSATGARPGNPEGARSRRRIRVAA